MTLASDHQSGADDLVEANALYSSHLFQIVFSSLIFSYDNKHQININLEVDVIS